MRADVRAGLDETPTARLTGVLEALGVASSSWYHQHVPPEVRRRPGPAPQPIPEDVMLAVVQLAVDNPWYGYQRIAVMCRREQVLVTNRQAYQVATTTETILTLGINGRDLHTPFKTHPAGPAGG